VHSNFDVAGMFPHLVGRSALEVLGHFMNYLPGALGCCCKADSDPRG
jgi:hypothetical protein